MVDDLGAAPRTVFCSSALPWGQGGVSRTMQFFKSSLILLVAFRVALYHDGDLGLAQGSAPVLSEEGLLEVAKFPLQPPCRPQPSPPPPPGISSAQTPGSLADPSPGPHTWKTPFSARASALPPRVSSRFEVVVSPCASRGEPSSPFIDWVPPGAEAGDGGTLVGDRWRRPMCSSASLGGTTNTFSVRVSRVSGKGK